MKKIIYFCKHGEAVSDWDITTTVDWICDLKIDDIPLYFKNTDKYSFHLNNYISNCIKCNYKNLIVDMSNFDDYILNDKIPFFYSTH